MVYNSEDRVREDLGGGARDRQVRNTSDRYDGSIAAVATPPGYGGIGVIRISGSEARRAAYHVLGEEPQPRIAGIYEFLDKDQAPIDQGVVLFFKGPYSYTGEDVLELHGHGSPAALELLMTRILELGGVRLARPGEFTERAYLNGKLDLAQAEAVADLIESRTHAAVRAAKKSLEGVFSKEIASFSKKLGALRVHVEAEIDFAEEPVGAIDADNLCKELKEAIAALESLLQKAQRGVLLGGGARLVLAGKPNAGKSSLMNALLAEERSIVHESPGTTRDTIEAEIDVDGLLVRLTDTAGLRHSDDEVETEGVRRAGAAIRAADLVLAIIDDADDDQHYHERLIGAPEGTKILAIRNKCDITGRPYGAALNSSGEPFVAVSATEGRGISALLGEIKEQLGYATDSTEEPFMARQRHLRALEATKASLLMAIDNTKDERGIELVAEDLRASQLALSEILGEVSNEDLLGEIFASFCIGK